MTDVAELIRRQRSEIRRVASDFVAAVANNDREALAQTIEALEWNGGLSAAFRKVASLEVVHADLRAAFLAYWLECGDSIRSLVSDDKILLSALRVLLPPYAGPPVRLYRGDSAWNRSKRSYGMSWTDDLDIADQFARGMYRTFTGGSVVLQADAAPEAIICAVRAQDDRYQEREHLVDRRILKNVKVLTRYSQVSLDQVQTVVAG
jgi:hypothetical protein